MLREIIAISGKIQLVTVHCREQNYKDPRYIAPYKLKEMLQTSVEANFPGVKVAVHVHNFKTSRVFHDRTLDFKIIDSDGCSVMHRYDLTGGIDFLMDKNAATKVYRYQIEE